MPTDSAKTIFVEIGSSGRDYYDEKGGPVMRKTSIKAIKTNGISRETQKQIKMVFGSQSQAREKWDSANKQRCQKTTTSQKSRYKTKRMKYIKTGNGRSAEALRQRLKKFKQTGLRRGGSGAGKVKIGEICDFC
jgi:hypothetical protein